MLYPTFDIIGKLPVDICVENKRVLKAGSGNARLAVVLMSLSPFVDKKY